jgi:hypothetical protein
LSCCSSPLSTWFATAPAAGAVDQVVGVVTSQPMYSFTDVTVSSMALFVLGGSASGVSPVLSLLIALVVFAVGAYRARRLASADHDDSSSDSTPPCSPAPSPEPNQALEYSPVSDTPVYWDDPPGSPSSDGECSSDQHGPVLHEPSSSASWVCATDRRAVPRLRLLP